jgi:hypothetical protein
MPVENTKMLARARNDREARVFKDVIYEAILTGPLELLIMEELTCRGSRLSRSMRPKGS